MANLTKIVECKNEQAYNGIAQKDENALYLTPENTISIQAGNGIEVEKTVDNEGNETYTVSTIAPTNFIEAYRKGYNFNGKTITFESANYNNGCCYKILFNNGYYIYGECGGGMGVAVYNPYGGEIDFYEYYGDLPKPYTFRDGVNDIGTNATIASFWLDTEWYGVDDANFIEVTPGEFAQYVTINIVVED